MSAGAPALVALHDDGGAAESAAWAAFAGARDETAFLGSWLAIACAQIRHTRGALLLLRQGQESRFGAAAVWPDPARDMQYLAPVAERTLKERRGWVAPVDAPGGGAAHVGYPIEFDGQLHGAVVLDLPRLPPADLQRALRLLHWASAWLVERLRAQAQATEAGRAARATLVCELLATVMQAAEPAAGAQALADELTRRLDCERVSIGLERGGRVVVQAISHTAVFDVRSALARQIGEAMDEVLDLGEALVWPAAADDETGAMAQAALAQAAHRGAVCSVPLRQAGRIVGAITLERGRPSEPVDPAAADAAALRPFDEAEVVTLTALAVLLGPLLVLRQQAARGVWQRSGDRLHEAWQAVRQPGRPGVRLLLVAAAALLAAGAWRVPYRVPAHAVIEGELRRAAIVPFDGVLGEALVHPGDRVRRGQVLASLADRDLRLEQSRWHSERELADSQVRAATAQQDRAAAVIAQARRQQAEAQLALVEERLARSTVTAPIDALVAEGDLSLQIGGPVQQGKVLFELVPLERYRVALDVDERDIAQVRAGQPGHLVTAAMPGRELPLRVSRVTPLASAQDGHNGFRVEATLALGDAQAAALARQLRPGMEGMAKIDTVDVPLARALGQRLVDALRLGFWRLMP